MKTLKIEKDTYHLYSNYNNEEYLFISNHDHGLKNIYNNIKESNNYIYDGSGSTLIFHGRTTPFVIQKSSNIILKNFTIDFVRPFFTEGSVISSTHNKVVLKIDKLKYPFKIENNRIVFFDHENSWENTYIKWFIEFDRDKKRPADGKKGNDLRAQNVFAKEIENNIVEFTANFTEIHKEGNIINITHEQRFNPGIFINDSKNILLENIIINHTGAMGIIAQNSKNITLDHISVKPSGDRYVSTNNDATHFVNCSGYINIRNCYFSNQLDDGVNVQGIYHPINSIDNNILELKVGHFQQEGVFLYKKGDKVAVVNPLTHAKKGIIKITKIEYINRQYIKLSIKNLSNIEISVNDCIENFNNMPQLIIEKSTFKNNRARGILTSTNKPVKIFNNNFFTSGSAICCGGEMGFWYESGSFDNIKIINNNFINCGYAKWGLAIISINSEIKEFVENTYINNELLIENNTFEIVEPPILNLISIKKCIFNNNKIIKSNDFIPHKNIDKLLIANHCNEVIFEGDDNIL